MQNKTHNNNANKPIDAKVELVTDREQSIPTAVSVRCTVVTKVSISPENKWAKQTALSFQKWSLEDKWKERSKIILDEKLVIPVLPTTTFEVAARIFLTKRHLLGRTSTSLIIQRLGCMLENHSNRQRGTLSLAEYCHVVSCRNAKLARTNVCVLLELETNQTNTPNPTKQQTNNPKEWRHPVNWARHVFAIELKSWEVRLFPHSAEKKNSELRKTNPALSHSRMTALTLN